MSVPARLTAFAALLAAAFALAFGVGAAADLGRTEAEAEPGHGSMGGHGEAHGGGDRVDAVRGLAVSADGLTLDLDHARARVRERHELRFAIRDVRGHVVRDFDVEHTKRMHVIVVRRDLTGFQHVHPTQATDGSWSVPVTLGRPGTYRVFADFSTDETPRTLATDLAVDGPSRARALPAPARAVRVDGMQVALAPGADRAGREAELDVEVTRDGRPVRVQPYLGARGHLVALREGDLAFLHVHPDRDRLRFAAHFPSAGRYRLFLQFREGGRVHTAAFTREVSR